MDKYYYKLTGADLSALVKNGLITSTQRHLITETSYKRLPGKFADNIVSFPLNKSGTIFVNSIRFYGGENFNEPFYFLAEITHSTNRSSFTKFRRKHKLTLRLPFTY